MATEEEGDYDSDDYFRLRNYGKADCLRLIDHFWSDGKDRRVLAGVILGAKSGFSHLNKG